MVSGNGRLWSAGVADMPKLTRTVRSALLVGALVIAPAVARAATITQSFSALPVFSATGGTLIVPLSPANNLPVNQFDPANGTLVDIRWNLLGQVSWLTNQPDAFTVSLFGGGNLVATQTFFDGPGIDAGGNVVPELHNIIFNLTAFSTDAVNTFPLYIGTGTTNPPVLSFGDVVPGDSFVIDPLTGTLTFDFTPNAAVPEPSTWAMMLLGFAGLGFAFRQSRRKMLLA
jgi:hypothetical protein